MGRYLGPIIASDVETIFFSVLFFLVVRFVFFFFLTTMNIAGRIRRSFFGDEKKELPSVNGSSSGNEDDLLGVTDELIDHVRSFTIDTFKNFSLYGNFEFRGLDFL